MRLGASDIAGATGGRLILGSPGAAGAPSSLVVDGVSIDSRSVGPGQLFVPVVADRDGHDFVAAAVAAGAAAYLSSRGEVVPGVPRIEVEDTGRALLAIGGLARGLLPSRVVGITGSVGKTSVKDLTAAALAARYRTTASQKSFNNELGVPLTLANAPAGTEAAVVEMGARGRGHIALLCGVARPTIGVVTVVAGAHTELFGSVEEVAVAKGELIEALPPDGTAVLNAADHRVMTMRSRASARCVSFAGMPGTPADVTAEDVTLDDELRPSFRLCSPWGSAEVRLEVRGLHNVGNALAAAAAAMAAGVIPDEVARGLAGAQLSPWRMELLRTPDGVTILNDAYNANPTSMEAALRSLAALPARRRVAVMGLMAELGEEGPAEHLRMAGLAESLGIELVPVGTDLYGVPPAADIDAAARRLAELGAGDAVLVKGSRVAGLERLAEILSAGGGSSG